MPAPHWHRLLASGLFLTGAEAAQAQLPSAPAPAPGEAGSVILTPVAPAPVACAPARRTGFFYKAASRGSVLHTATWPETPLGATVDLHFQTHITNAAVARMALYDYDFVRDGEQLNARGMERVRQLAVAVARTPFPIVVERTPLVPGLAEKRRCAVLTELAAALGPIPADRVVVGSPLATPLQGVEAELIYQNLLRLTESYGTVPSTGVSGGTGNVIGGFGGGGSGTGGTGR